MEFPHKMVASVRKRHLIFHKRTKLTDPLEPRIEGIQLGSLNCPPPELLTYEFERAPLDIEIRDSGGLRFLFRSESRFMFQPTQLHQLKPSVMT